MTDQHDHEHAGPTFGAYMGVFIALCVCTAASFIVNRIFGDNNITGAGIIMCVAVVKATLVAGIFMHLKFDWGKLYCIILPVCIVTVMMVIILSIDATLAWQAYPESAILDPVTQAGASMLRLSAILLVLLAAGPLCAQDDKKPEPFTPFDYPVGNFQLQDRSGKYVTARDLRGTISIAQFFYPGCTGACTKTAPNMKKLQDAFRGKPYVRLVSIALHADTLDTLNRYAEAQNAEPEQWLFLTDQNEDHVHHVVQTAFYSHAMRSKDKTPGREIDHSERLMLIDPDGLMIGYVDGTKDEAFEVMKREVERLRMAQRVPITVAQIPWFNAMLNSSCTILLILGWIAICLRWETVHKMLMLLALAVSMVFLVSYLYYHFVVMGMEPTRFPGTGVARYAYFAILLSHTILAMVVAPMALTITVQGLRDARLIHRKLAKWTLPIWIYVSVTGVVVYWMLYRVEW